MKTTRTFLVVFTSGRCAGEIRSYHSTRALAEAKLARLGARPDLAVMTRAEWDAMSLSVSVNGLVLTGRARAKLDALRERAAAKAVR